MKTDNNRKQLLKGVLAGSVSLTALQQAITPAKPVVGIWEEISPDLYRHKDTGQERPATSFEQDYPGPFVDFNIPVKKFWDNGQRVPNLATSERTVLVDDIKL